MTWTYTASSTTALNRVRRRIGDTNTNDQLLQDEEIQDFLDEYAEDLYATAAASCEAICAKLARDTAHTVQGMSNSRNEKFDHYEKLAEKMWSKARMVTTPSYGGASVADQEDFDSDTDLKPYSFRVGKDDKDGTAGTNGSETQ